MCPKEGNLIILHIPYSRDFVIFPVSILSILFSLLLFLATFRVREPKMISNGKLWQGEATEYRKRQNPLSVETGKR